MDVINIKNQLLAYNSSGKRMFTTSSFQTHSIPLLHIISELELDIDILFLNTGYHFPETLNFKEEIKNLLGLKIIEVNSIIPKSQQKNLQGDLYFISDPDYCCYLNKTAPLEPHLREYDIWINGVRADQSSTRKSFKMEESTPFKAIRFHPILDWNSKQIYEYRKLHNLPEHPLDQKGYASIGCVPCTRKHDFTDERMARWFGLNKSECGLHVDLITKKNNL